MDCEKCPIKAECSETKRLVNKQKGVFIDCLLMEVAEQALEKCYGTLRAYGIMLKLSRLEPPPRIDCKEVKDGSGRT